MDKLRAFSLLAACSRNLSLERDLLCKLKLCNYSEKNVKHGEFTSYGYVGYTIKPNVLGFRMKWVMAQS